MIPESRTSRGRPTDEEALAQHLATAVEEARTATSISAAIALERALRAAESEEEDEVGEAIDRIHSDE